MVAATELEAAPLLGAVAGETGTSDPDGGRPGAGDGPAVLVAGVGAAGAPPLRRSLRRLRPLAVLQLGLAGALDPDLAPGRRVAVGAWRRAAAPWDLRESAAAELTDRLLAADHDLEVVTAVTVDAPFHDRRRRDELHRASGARIVEMEGARWAGIAREAGIPCAALRVISDRADRRLPLPRHRLLDAGGRVRWGRWLRALIRSGGWRRPRAAVADLGAARHDWRSAMQGLRAAATLATRLADALAER